MTTMTVELRNIPGTEAAMGWAGGHTAVVDRPDGTAGGKDLGFNGGQMLALAIGGCFCNDLCYVAHDRGVHLAAIAVTVVIELASDFLLVTGATMDVRVEASPSNEDDVEEIIGLAEKNSTVSNSIRNGFPVTLTP